MEKVRKLIDKENNYKEFSILNSKGKQYNLKLRYIFAEEDMTNFILDNNMIYPLASQKDLIQCIRKASTQFYFHLVNKFYGDKVFVMLHLQSKDK